jgi:hypothetical protein
MSIADELRKAAQEIADHATSRISELDRQIAEIEKKKKEIDADRVKARDSLKRLANYPVMLGGDYQCPLCWVGEGKMSPFRPVPSSDRNDIFRCALCQFEQVIPP